MNGFDALQRRAAELAAAAWPDDQPSPELGDALVAQLAEETCEVAQAVRRFWRKWWGRNGETMATAIDVEEELGDLLFVAARIADLCGVSLGAAAYRAVAKFEDRLQQVVKKL